METQRPWHHLFGLSLIDLLRGQPMTVELEKDLSLKQQLLDVVIIRRGSGSLTQRLPDGLEDLAAHNLISFKSYQESLDGWAVNELIGHYVNYRKQVSPSMRELLPESEFRLFAVTVRFPQSLARQVNLVMVRPGVYELPHFTGNLRVVVVHELPQEENNAIFHLFSAKSDLLSYGSTHYRVRSDETSTLLLQLINQYRQENIVMPDALEKFTKEYIAELLKNMPTEERLKGLTAEEVFKRFPAKERLKGLSTNDLLQLINQYRQGNIVMPDALEKFTKEYIAELLKNMPTEERLKGLTAEEVFKRFPAKERLKGLSTNDLLQLINQYRQENIVMPDALEKFTKEYIAELLKKMPPEERLKDLSTDDLLEALPPEKLAALVQRIKEKGQP